ncbi:MAG: hypothetical protein H0U67_02475 [Gemmatimonadetes bacterium]|nr:hypothetical protein [Gemmatimonadota bacterium]
MIKRLALGGVFVSVLAIAVAFASAFLPSGAPGWAPWLMAIGTSASMVCTMALGAARGGRIGKLAIPFAFVFLVLVGGFWLVLALPPADPENLDLWLGLPPRAAVILYGIGLLPLFAVPVAYALTFDEMTLSQDDLDRVRAAARVLREDAAAKVEVAVPEPDAEVEEVLR